MGVSRLKQSFYRREILILLSYTSLMYGIPTNAQEKFVMSLQHQKSSICLSVRQLVHLLQTDL